MSRPSIVAIAALGTSIIFSGCRPEDRPVPTAAGSPGPEVRRSVGRPVRKTTPAVDPATVAAPRFTDVHGRAGIEFVYENGSVDKNLMVESIGGGAGWLDYDADGRHDLYLTQGGDPTAAPGARMPPEHLYRSLGGERFAEVAGRAGLGDVGGYGQGVAAADFDGDGFEDLYVTNVGPNVLLRNMGDGTFEDVTAAAGVGDPRWSTSAAWADLDVDGDLDLFVCNYLLYDPRDPFPCFDDEGRPGICDPTEIEACPNECFFNQGDGRFTAEATGRGLEPNDGNSKSLGVAILDFDGDALPDVFVANDTRPNYLFVNLGGGRFEERAVALGCAMNADGLFQANMGVGVGDYDRDGLPDIYITHFTDDPDTLYRNLGAAGFQDVTRRVGLYEPTYDPLGFGAVMADFNRDGREDVFVTNGHIEDLTAKGIDYAMRPQVLCYAGSRWVEVTDRAGPFFEGRYVGRAAAACDYDDDGDLDLAVVHQNAPAALLRNEADGGRWLKVRLVGVGLNRKGIGARVTVGCGDEVLVRHLAGGTSYASTHEPAVIFAFAAADGPCDVSVRWPDGVVQNVSGVPLDGEVVIRERERGRPAVGGVIEAAGADAEGEATR